MTEEMQLNLRLEFLCRVVDKEVEHLESTCQRLFEADLTVERLTQFTQDQMMAERLDAFVSRFGRLQDTLADKLLPALLLKLAERPGSALHNLDRAEQLGWLPSVSEWLVIRKLRNQMVHEYIEDLQILAHALNAGRAFVPQLIDVKQRLVAQFLENY